MRSGIRIAALALLLTVLAGCMHRAKNTAPPQAAQAPSLPPSEMATLSSPMPPPLPPTSERPLKLDTTTPPEPSPAPAVPPKHTVRHRPKPAAQENAPQEHPSAQAAAQSQPAAQAPTEAQTNPSEVAKAASTGQPPEMSPIGQLSTTNDTANTADRQNIAKDIDSTETGLNAIKRAFSADEQKTVTQIRTFITRARDALRADDLDGARTLSTKAKLLLQELKKE